MKAAPDNAPAREERVATLSGDRLCVGCHYNLTGQTIVREPHHGLLIVRCPECGRVASIQEYPLLGRWATRWGVTLAVLWFIFVFAAWPASALLIFRFTVETAEQASRRYGSEIRSAYRDALRAPGSTLQVAPTGSRPPSTATTNFEMWWASQDPADLLADAGGWSGAVNWRALWVWLPAAFATFCIGWFWSIVLLHLRRRALVLWAFAVLALAAVFVAFATWDWHTTSNPQPWLAGRAQLGPPLVAMTLAWCAVALIAGTLLGRPVTRLMVRALLAPRLRAPLSVLWTAEGLPPPATRARGGSG